MSAATDPLARASDHVPDAGGSSGVIPAGLWQQRAGRHFNLYLLHLLQSVLNAAPRLIFYLKRSDHITDALVSLHWLRVPERIQ